ncbi:MAG: galactoside O-acetyltransferase [Myxococcales bacterium]|nr:galactoside O-acetyltransferase [Myxococcales bacterium]
MDDFGLAVGPRVSFTIDEGGAIRIGRRVQLREGCEVWAVGGRIDIGENVFFNRFCSLIARGGIEIGSDCLFGPNVGVYDHDHRFDDDTRPIWAQAHRVAPVSIGSNVWIGANAIITAGAQIGDRVVVGANSVVTGDVESGTMVAGVPAKLVRRL